jgi:beta-glucanase (GH16 family)
VKNRTSGGARGRGDSAEGPGGRPGRRRVDRALRFLSALLVPAIAASCLDRSPTAIDDWTLVWEDEFDGPAGQLPDPDRWAFDIGTDWGNDQLEYDTDRPENASLDGEGRLAITARREAWEGQPYTSARIHTRGRFAQLEGRFAARIRLPSGRGLWPAFWMLGSDFGVVGWPAAGEIDVMEYRGQEPTRVLGSLHGPGYSAGESITGYYALERGRFDTAFHVFSVEWTGDDITWFVDDAPYLRVRRGDVPGPWVFDQPFFLLLNVAVGGNFVGPPDESTPFPQTMLVDWVRVYRAGS